MFLIKIEAYPQELERTYIPVRISMSKIQKYFVYIIIPTELEMEFNL